MYVMLRIALFGNDGMARNSLTEVIDGEKSPHFLFDIAALTPVEMQDINGVLQVTERCLNSPAGVIKLFHALKRELDVTEVGSKVLVDAVSNHDTDNTKVKRKLRSLGKIVKMAVRNKGVGVSVSLDFACLPVCKDGADFTVKLAVFVA